MLAALCNTRGHHTFCKAKQRNAIEVLQVDRKGLISVTQVPSDSDITSINSVGASLLIGLKSGDVLVYDTETNSVSTRYSFGQGPVKFASEREFLLAITQDGRVHKAVEQGEHVSSSQKFKNAEAVFEGANGQLVVFCADTIFELDSKTLEQVNKFPADSAECVEYVSPYLITSKDRVISVKTKKGVITLNASGSVSKLVAKRSDDSVLVVALAQEILNVWHIFPLEMSQKIGTPNKLIDISSSFQGRIKTLSLPDDNTCVMGAVDENGKLTQVQITHLLRQSVIRCFSEEGLSKEQYRALSFEEQLAYDKKQQSNITNNTEHEITHIDFEDTREANVIADQLRVHLRSLAHMSPTEFQQNLFAIPVIPSRPSTQVALREALSRLSSPEINNIVQLSVGYFSAAPVEHVRVLVWLRHLLECSAYFMSVAGSQHALSQLNDEIAARMDVYKDCMRLHGRTKLIITQLGHRNTGVLPGDRDSEEVSIDYDEDEDGYSGELHQNTENIESSDEEIDSNEI